MTTDTWTSFTNEAYISLTVHFTDDCWEMKSYTRATYLFPEQHTSDNIVEKLKEVVSEYQIDDNKIFAIVHDQGSNFQQAGRLLEDDKQWKSVNCVAHCLQLCVIEGFSINTIAQALGAAKSCKSLLMACKSLLLNGLDKEIDDQELLLVAINKTVVFQMVVKCFDD